MNIKKQQAVGDIIDRAARLPDSLPNLAGMAPELKAMLDSGEDIKGINLRAMSLSAGIKDYAAAIPERGVPDTGPASRIANIALELGLQILSAGLPPTWGTGALAVMATIVAGRLHPEWLAAWGQLLTSYPADDLDGVAEELMQSLPVPARFPEVLEAINAMNERIAAHAEEAAS